MLEQRSDSLQVNTAQSQARVMSLEQEKVLKKCSVAFYFISGVVYQLIVESFLSLQLFSLSSATMAYIGHKLFMISTNHKKT